MTVAYNELLYKKILTKVRSVNSGRISSYSPEHTDLLDTIKRQTIAFGGGVDDLAKTCEWIVDNDEDDPDNWMNVRPY